MKRWLPFLLFGLALVGMGLVLSNYASDQAGKLVSGAAEEAPDKPDEVDVAACNRAQAKYDELWDQSLENPDDAEKEEQLGVALGELYSACGSEEIVEAGDATETGDSANTGEVEDAN